MRDLEKLSDSKLVAAINDGRFRDYLFGEGVYMVEVNNSSSVEHSYINVIDSIHRLHDNGKYDTKNLLFNCLDKEFSGPASNNILKAIHVVSVEMDYEKTHRDTFKIDSKYLLKKCAENLNKNKQIYKDIGFWTSIETYDFTIAKKHDERIL